MSKKNKLIPELRFPEFAKPWNIILVSDVCDVYRGSTFSKADMNENGTEPCIHYGELFTKYNEVISCVHSRTYRSDGFRSEVGDILMPSSDVTPDGLAKASAIMLDNVVLGGDMNILRSKANIDSIFLSYLLNHSKKEIIKLVSGTTVKHIYPSQIITCQLPIVDSEPEQKKIAACLSSLDEVITSHSKKLELLKEHKRGLMQSLFPQEGEKVPKYRFKEFSNKGEWMTGKVGDLVNTVMGNAFKSEDFEEDGIQLVRMGNLYQGDLLLNRMPVFLPLKYKEEYYKFLIKPLDILMSMTGTLGKRDYGFVIQTPKDCPDLLLNQRVLKIIPQKNCIKGFILQLMKADFFLEKLYSLPGGTKQANLSVNQLSGITVLFPSVNEQQKIASCLSYVDGLITTEAEEIEQLKLHKKGLMQGLFPQIND
ncbi:MAG: restriction endonuclease subunit S [Cytophaga sp.]|uniref:restriction endonuclease subunit S n=1 Tax=Cytophaga sp. TaxID=29535 RepID=UPI003F7D1F50